MDMPHRAESILCWSVRPRMPKAAVGDTVLTTERAFRRSLDAGTFIPVVGWRSPVALASDHPVSLANRSHWLRAEAALHWRRMLSHRCHLSAVTGPWRLQGSAVRGRERLVSKSSLVLSAARFVHHGADSCALTTRRRPSTGDCRLGRGQGRSQIAAIAGPKLHRFSGSGPRG
jgi:hypothetical protein